MGASSTDVVGNDERLWRRVHHDYYVPRKDGPGWRVSLGAFRTTDAQLSLDRVQILEAQGLGVAFTARGEPGVAELSAAEYRGQGLDPVPDPLKPGDLYVPGGNPAHAMVKTMLSRPQAKALSAACRFVTNP